MVAPNPNPDERGSKVENDENREPQESDAEDLEVTSDEAEGVAGGVRSPSDPDAGTQRL